jgi:hypothetical protein
MDQATLVEMQIQDGRRLTDKLAAEGIPVTAAFWAKEGESGQWYLYLATPLVGEDGATRAAYRRVNAVILQAQEDSCRIDPLEVKVIAPGNPIAKAAAAVRDRQAGIGPTWFRGDRLGGLSVEAAYIYPARKFFVFGYRRRGGTTTWDALPVQCKSFGPGERWADGEVRVAEQGGRVVISVYSEEALEEGDAVPAEELANEAFQKQFPGHTICYPDDEDTP